MRGLAVHFTFLVSVASANYPRDLKRRMHARFCLDLLARQYLSLSAEVSSIDKRIHAWHRACEESRRLEEIPGIGPIVATALLKAEFLNMENHWLTLARSYGFTESLGDFTTANS